MVLLVSRDGLDLARPVQKIPEQFSAALDEVQRQTRRRR
jgi:hypothetical protein